MITYSTLFPFLVSFSAKRCFLCLVVCVFLAGCMRVGPDFESPRANIPQGWTEKEETAFGFAELQQPWWKNFDDPVLDELVDWALKGNFNLEAGVYRIAAARANLGFAIGQYFPQTQQAEGASLNTRLSANAPNTLNADRRFIDSILGFRVSWELDFWGRYYRGVETAYGEYLASYEDYEDIKRILVAEVVLAYVQQKTFQQRIATLENNIAIQYRSVEIAKVRWEEGYESELDHAQAVTLWKETVAQKIALETNLKRVTTALAILLGLTPEEFACRFRIDSTPVHAPTYADLSYPASVLCNRPDLKRTLDLLYAQSARIGIAVSDLYPRISFTGFIGLETASHCNTTFNQGSKKLFSHHSLTFFYGPDFAWPILNYGRLENKVKEQYALLQEGVAVYRNLVLEAFKEVEDALTFFVNSMNESEHLEQSYLSAKRAVEVATLQYQEGLADYTRVLNSLQQQVRAEDNLAQALGNIGLAYALIYKSLGAPVAR